MPLSYSLKRRRDAEFHALCDSLPAEKFGDSGVHRAAIKALQTQLSGRIVLPGEPGYDSGRMLSNPVFNFHPMAIIYCATEADVAEALRVASMTNLPFALRSGGHCTAGFSGSNGLMIDVKGLNGILIDPVGSTATVGCGVEWGQFQQSLDPYGLHVPGGECSEVCVGGYVQGGGFGFTCATFGMSCDNVAEVRVMLADGSIVVANANQNADLLWAVCGGTGGNFGVLLTVKFALHKFRTAYGFALTWSLNSAANIALAAQVMMLLQAKYMQNSICGSDMTLQIHLGFQNVGAAGAMEPFLMVRGLYAGDPALGPQMIAPLKALPGVLPQVGWEQVDTFYVLNKMLLERPQGMPPMPPGPDPLEDKSSHYVSRDLTLAEWTDMLTMITTSVPNRAFGYLEVYGGAINAAPPLMNAFVHRAASFNLVMDVFWRDSSDRLASEQFLARWNQLVEAYWNGEVYQNYPSVVDANYAIEYWAGAYPTLQQVKAKYDPGNFFTFAQGVVGNTGAQVPANTPPAVVAALKVAPVFTGGLARA